MTENSWTQAAFAPPNIAIYLVIVAIALATMVRLRRQWIRLDIAPANRMREFGALVLATVCVLALVAVGSVYLHQQQEQARLQAEMRERSALAADLQKKITAQLDVASSVLADRAVQKISEQKIVEARAELARFAPFGDARIGRMLALLDVELEIRRLVRLALDETEPPRLLTIYRRLAQLDPHNAAYQAHIERYGALAGSAAQPEGAARKP